MGIREGFGMNDVIIIPGIELTCNQLFPLKNKINFHYLFRTTPIQVIYKHLVPDSFNRNVPLSTNTLTLMLWSASASFTAALTIDISDTSLSE